MMRWVSRFVSQPLPNEDDVFEHQFEVLAVEEHHRVKDGVALATHKALGVYDEAISGESVTISIEPPPVTAIVHVHVT